VEVYYTSTGKGKDGQIISVWAPTNKHSDKSENGKKVYLAYQEKEKSMSNTRV